MERVKFTQLYVTLNHTYAIDDDGEIWELKYDEHAAYIWFKLPSAYRQHKAAPEAGRVLKPPTPEQLRRQEEREFEAATSLKDRIKKHANV